MNYAFDIVGRKWNAIIISSIHRCDNCVTSFSVLKESIGKITPKALSLKLSELIEYGIVEKVLIRKSQPAKYRLTKKGIALAESFGSIETWALKYAKPTKRKTMVIRPLSEIKPIQ